MQKIFELTFVVLRGFCLEWGPYKGRMIVRNVHVWGVEVTKIACHFCVSPEAP